jgi:hypothetical protein
MVVTKTEKPARNEKRRVFRPAFSRLETSLLEQTQDALLGLRRDLQGHHTQRLSGLERREIGPFGVEIGDRQLRCTTLQGADIALRELQAHRENRVGRAECGLIRGKAGQSLTDGQLGRDDQVEVHTSNRRTCRRWL